tara:strand:- start:134 stop:1021 length:888 start_codon:yes stop_codon:yes gene_type:complete
MRVEKKLCENLELLTALIFPTKLGTKDSAPHLHARVTGTSKSSASPISTMVSSALASARRAAAHLARSACAARVSGPASVSSQATSSSIPWRHGTSRRSPALSDTKTFATSTEATSPLYTRTHEILRPAGDAQGGSEQVSSSASDKSNDDDSVTLRVGLADRAFDLIGDVKGIEDTKSAGDTSKGHENMCLLTWEGFTRTASDELYHAVWANSSGVRKFSLPFQSEVIGFNQDAVADPYKVVGPSEKGWIVEVKVSKQVLEHALKNEQIMPENKYKEMCDAEEEEEDAAASRAYP